MLIGSYNFKQNHKNLLKLRNTNRNIVVFFKYISELSIISRFYLVIKLSNTLQNKNVINLYYLLFIPSIIKCRKLSFIRIYMHINASNAEKTKSFLNASNDYHVLASIFKRYYKHMHTLKQLLRYVRM